MASVRQNRFGKLLGIKAFVGPVVGKIGGSESYLAEQLTVKATVENEYGESASATRMTNFTVVKVDVAIGGVGEDREETEVAFVQYVPDAPGGLWTSEVTQSVVRVSITCESELTTNEMVSIAAPEGALYARLNGKNYAMPVEFDIRRITNSWVAGKCRN